VKHSPLSSFLLGSLSFVAACWLASCAASLGPGYVVEQQKILVTFQPQPIIHVAAEYRLKNTGNRPLDSLDVRLPGRRFGMANLAISIDGALVAPSSSPDNPRDTLLRFPSSWPIGWSASASLTIFPPPRAAWRHCFSAQAFLCRRKAGRLRFRRSAVFGFGGSSEGMGSNHSCSAEFSCSRIRQERWAFSKTANLNFDSNNPRQT
jgi:hypothetical protein